MKFRFTPDKCKREYNNTCRKKGHNATRLDFVPVGHRRVTKFDSVPTKEEVLVDLREARGERIPDAIKLVDTYEVLAGEPVSFDWLRERTDNLIRTRYQHEILLEYFDEDRKHPGTDITPFALKLLSPPLLPSTKVDYCYSDSLDFIDGMIGYFQEHPLIPFRKAAFNEITGGGSRPGSMNAIIAGTGVGKSLICVDMGAGFLLDGRNVLYFSGELNRSVVQARFLSNLTGIPVDEIKNKHISSTDLRAKWTELGPIGRLVIDDFGTGHGNTDLFRSRTRIFEQRGFIPDIIIIDQLTNCIPAGAISADKYARDERYGMVAQDFHCLAQERNIPIWTACQTNRSGQNGEVELVHMGDSHKISQDADTILSTWRHADNQIFIRPLKRREGGSDAPRLLYQDRDRMRLSDIEENRVEMEKKQAQDVYKSRKAAHK